MTVADDLRALADLAERDEFAARLIASAAATAFPAMRADADVDAKTAMAQAIRAFKSIPGATIEKQYYGNWFTAEVHVGKVRIELTESRESVCERVVTGTREVAEEIPDPEYIAAAPKVTQTRTEEVVEWNCASIMGGA